MKFDKKIAEAIKLELEKQLSSEVFEEHLVTKKIVRIHLRKVPTCLGLKNT